GKLDTYTPEVKAEIVRWEEASGGDAPEQMQRVWQNALSSRWDRPPVWVHGDMAPGNVLLDARGQFLGLIDFGSLGVGDPACDGTMLWTFFRGAAREAFQAAIEFDAATWDRARGWALWKAAITAAKGGSVGRAGANTLRFVLSDAP
ncbi:MAG: phosphotransferase, partial [Pseudomonadota bacterium]